MSQTNPPPPSRLASIDVLRGLAALAVLLFHGLGVFTASLRDSYPILYALTYPITAGFIGVHLFLILSGFCIHMRLAKSDQPEGSYRLPLRQFWAKRFWRLYPAYLATLILSSAFVVLTGAWLNNDLTVAGLTAQWDTIYTNVLAHMVMGHLFFPTFAMALNGVLWSLALEEHLYLLYSPVLWIRNRWGVSGLLLISGVVSVLWRSVSIGLFEAGPSMPAGIPELNNFLLLQAPSRWFEWCLGVAAVEAYVGRITLPAWCKQTKVCLISAVMALLCSHHPVAWIFREPLWGVCFFTLVNLVVNREKSGSQFNTGLLLRAIGGLGVISYSVYLIHLPMFAAAKLLVYNFGWGEMAFLGMRVAMVLVAIPLGYLFYRLFEKPFITQQAHKSARKRELNASSQKHYSRAA